jgi:2-C-methyl-D-erythritol 2,4-cyclodiphosphate synthase
MTSKLKLRIGTGYDIHRLVLARRLMLGGVHIPFDQGLEGHSDGDVLLHAIIDALLGAAGLGDIGLFFPSTDEKIANIASTLLLSDVLNRLKQKNYAIVNIDCVVICERPKLSQYYVAMQATISKTLACDPQQINVKAKTADGIGEIGKGDAIAAQVCALIEKQD